MKWREKRVGIMIKFSTTRAERQILSASQDKTLYIRAKYDCAIRYSTNVHSVLNATPDIHLTLTFNTILVRESLNKTPFN